MFKNHPGRSVVARRASRVAFGGVSIVGAIALLTSTFRGHSN
jgi:hypothetical protein